MPPAAIVPLLAVRGVWRRASPHPRPDVTGRLQAAAVLAPAGRIARTFRVIDDGDVDVLKSLSRRASA